MKLIDILVRELPKRGGWPEGYYRCAQNIYGEVIFETLPEGFQVSATTIFTFGSLAEDFADEEVTREQYEAALKQPVWDGTGLPPVGVECEGKQFAQLNWTKFKVVAVENGHVFGFWKDSVSVGLDSKLWQFRPIRSERDEAIEALASTICGDIPDTGMATAVMYATRIYDAGYRKQ